VGVFPVDYVRVKAVFYNANDYVKYLRRELGLGDVRRVEVEALADTGATPPALPEDVIEKLGLPRLTVRLAKTARGVEEMEIVGNAIIEIEGETAQTLIVRRPKETTPLVGIVALEQMGYRVDPVTGRLLQFYN
jgi:clan AA aspartic protease